MQTELPVGKRILILGGGKIGTDLAVLLAAENRVRVASRFSHKDERGRLHDAGVETIEIDLAPDRIASLPRDADYVHLQYAFHAHAAEQPARAFEINTYTTAALMDYYRDAQCIVSSGTVNVFDRAPEDIVEDDDWPAPHGPYALSRYGAEVIIGTVSHLHGTTAIGLRYCYGQARSYGLLRRLAKLIDDGEPIPQSLGDHVSIIAHEDLVRYTALATMAGSTPAEFVNCTAPEPIPLRPIVQRICEQGGWDEPDWEPGPRDGVGLLFRCRRLVELFGPPTVEWQTMVDRAVEAHRAGEDTIGQS